MIRRICTAFAMLAFTTLSSVALAQTWQEAPAKTAPQNNYQLCKWPGVDGFLTGHWDGDDGVAYTISDSGEVDDVKNLVHMSGTGGTGKTSWTLAFDGLRVMLGTSGTYTVHTTKRLLAGGGMALIAEDFSHLDVTYGHGRNPSLRKLHKHGCP